VARRRLKKKKKKTQKEINIHCGKEAEIRVEVSFQRARSGMLLAQPCGMALSRV